MYELNVHRKAAPRFGALPAWLWRPRRFAAIIAFMLTTAIAVMGSMTAGACTGDCRADGAVSVDEVLLMVNIALNNLPLNSCSAGDGNGDGRITIDEIVGAIGSALTSCPPAARVVDFGLAFGSGPGGTTFLPLSLSADNVSAVTLDLCFPDTVFTFSESATFVGAGTRLESATVLDEVCVLPDAQFPRGRRLRVELVGDAGQPIPAAEFVTLAFDSFSTAAPGCYPVRLQATLRVSGGGTIVNAVEGALKVFVFLGESCETDCACASSFCRDRVCCEESCDGGTCNLPGSEGSCVRG